MEQQNLGKREKPLGQKKVREGYAQRRDDSSSGEEPRGQHVRAKKRRVNNKNAMHSGLDSEGEGCEPGSSMEQQNLGKKEKPLGQKKVKEGYAQRRDDSSSGEESRGQHVRARKRRVINKNAMHCDLDSEGEGCEPGSSMEQQNLGKKEKPLGQKKVKEGYAQRRDDSSSGEESKGQHVKAKKRRVNNKNAMHSDLDSEGEGCAPGSSMEQQDPSNEELKEMKPTGNVCVPCSKKNQHNVRKYDKRQCCYYCDKVCAKIARNYEFTHKDEEEVIKATAYPRGSRDRKKALEKLRLLGNFHHNLRVLESKSGQLIVMRRPGEDEECSQDDFLPCTHCLGFVKKKDLWRHVKVCSFKSGDCNDDKEGTKYQKLHTKGKLLILPSICASKSTLFQDVVASMKSDNITIVARNDVTISTFGTMMVEKVGLRRIHDVSQNMRNLARLLISLRGAEKNESAHLLQFLCPDKFDVVVQCVMEISKFNVSKGEKDVGTPSLALHLGHALKKCIGIERGKALREKDKVLFEDAENFEKLMEAEWNYRISHHSTATLNDRRHNQTDLLPVTSDLQKVKEYVTVNILSLTSQLQAASKPSLQIWRELSELVLNRLILFNKRRGGETARLSLEAYKNRPDWHKSTNKDVLLSLSSLEQQLLKRLDMVEVKGKRGRKVPILLTREVKKAIDVLVEKRNEAGVNPDNPYLFAVTGNGSLSHLRPWECLRKVITSEKWKLEKPEAVTSTRLRKYVATVSQILDLQDNELDWLPRHLGHDITVHREYYRLHESTIELAKVGKILTTVDDGKTSQWAGKSLDEMKLDDDITNFAGGSESCSEDESGSDSDTDLPMRNAQQVTSEQQSQTGRIGKSSKSETRVSKTPPSPPNAVEKVQQAKKVKKAKPKTKKNKYLVSDENSGSSASRPKKKKGYNPWTEEEKAVIFKYLGKFIKQKIYPGKNDCTKWRSSR